MKTAEKLIEMLTENTGKSFLDSGSAYGRHWQQNQGVDFNARPQGTLEVWTNDEDLDICATIDVFHFLKDRLEYNETLDVQYREFCEREDEHLEYQSAEAFASSLDGKGIYGDDSGPLVVNTYNGEDLLSQTLQYIYWTDDDGAHVLLQIHGGCDARGGYTDPVAFDVTDYDGTSIFDNARATIYCDDCGHYWDTEDGCHWYDEIRIDLEDYPATEERPEYPEQPDDKQAKFQGMPKRPEYSSGEVFVDDDKNIHCPFCGGILNVAPMCV